MNKKNILRLASIVGESRGVAAIEFALILPLMLILYLGAAEITHAIGTDRRVSLAARTVTDLVGRTTSLDCQGMSDSLGASSTVMAPYSVHPLTIILSSVQFDANGQGTIAWSIKWTETSTSPTIVSPAPEFPIGSPIVLTGDQARLAVANSSIIWGQANYLYQPTLGYVITGAFTMKDEMMMSPRLSQYVGFSGC
jgi:Flp pilus assembly protein TadG